MDINILSRRSSREQKQTTHTCAYRHIHKDSTIIPISRAHTHVNTDTHIHTQSTIIPRPCLFSEHTLTHIHTDTYTKYHHIYFQSTHTCKYRHIHTYTKYHHTSTVPIFRAHTHTNT